MTRVIETTFDDGTSEVAVIKDGMMLGTIGTWKTEGGGTQWHIHGQNDTVESKELGIEYLLRCNNPEKYQGGRVSACHATFRYLKDIYFEIDPTNKPENFNAPLNPRFFPNAVS